MLIHTHNTYFKFGGTEGHDAVERAHADATVGLSEGERVRFHYGVAVVGAVHQCLHSVQHSD